MDDRFLDLLNSVKKKNNSTFHSCEPELIELMRQIDEMIELKSQEWKTDVENLGSQLDEALNENGIIVKEVETLRLELSNEKKIHAQTLLQYEKDVRQLKNDMSSLKRRYVELQKKIDRSNKKKMISLDGKSSSFDTMTMMSEGRNHQQAVEKHQLQKQQSDILVLNLKIESLVIENNNLRILLKEQSKPILERHSQNGTICSSLATNQFTLVPPSQDSNHTNNTFNSTGFEIPKPQQSSSKAPQHSSSNSSRASGSLNMEYFDGDHSLEDKLNNILTQFETVSSSMVLS